MLGAPRLTYRRRGIVTDNGRISPRGVARDSGEAYSTAVRRIISYHVPVCWEYIYFSWYVVPFRACIHAIPVLGVAPRRGKT